MSARDALMLALTAENAASAATARMLIDEYAQDVIEGYQDDQRMRSEQDRKTAMSPERMAEIRAGRTEYRSTAQLDAAVDDLLLEVGRLRAAAGDTYELANRAEASDGPLKADPERDAFLQPGRTYASGTPFMAPELCSFFRVEHVTRHPDRGHLRAIGWLRSAAPGEGWHGSFLDDDQVEGWVEQPGEEVAERAV